jgi:hypothetical protein
VLRFDEDCCAAAIGMGLYKATDLPVAKHFNEIPLARPAAMQRFECSSMTGIEEP